MRASSTVTLRDHALRYAADGWPVFPTSRDKIPLVKDWPNVATTDPAQIAAWWRRWPSASIGHPTGSLVVVELDGTAGTEARRAQEAEGLDWPVTLTSISGRRDGGAHFWYDPQGVEVRNCAGVRSGRGIGAGIDVRGVGGFVVLPPSIHKSGRPYQWVVRMGPAALPAWMLSRLRAPAPKPRAPLPDRGDITRYAEAALDAEIEAVETAPIGTLNDTLNRAAYSLGRLVPTISEDTIRESLLAAALRNGHPERGARATIRSGLTAGMARR